MKFHENDLPFKHIEALEPVESYLKGHSTGDPECMRKAFHPDAKIVSFRDGMLQVLSVEEFAAKFQGQPAPDEAQRKRFITHFDVTMNAASAKVVLQYPEVEFTDYMTILNIDRVWKIINKTFYAEPRITPKE
ncbi:nuclear transport factor 2 family protein [Cupriavidus necator]